MDMLMETTPSTTATAGGCEVPTVDNPDFTIDRSSSPPSSPPSLLSLDTMEGRLHTFMGGNWPVTFLKPEEMAREGFFCINRGDAVKCVYCGVVLKQWEFGDVPRDEHRRWSPGCPFLKSLPGGCVDAVSYDLSSLELAPAPAPAPPAKHQLRPQPSPAPKVTPVHATQATFPQYRTFEARLASFKDWPVAIRVKPVTLSEAGFFYSGVGDRTVCYFCGRGLRDWEPTDDPWVEHELWFPGCRHVQLHRGNDFVSRIAQERDTLIAVKRNPRETAAVAQVESSKPRPQEEMLDNRVCKMENSATEEKSLCKICYENEMGVVFLPCGHIVACVSCALSLQDCPVCRQPLQNTVRVYLP